ncbi:MAG: SDR family NAD(P)-dependent oxidoreductase [Gemmatimonadales bacterium]|nr:SDR family NAD(P)-dependent oxidoreductase [Gemmatimonadales bacterium]MYG48800.1 SDR family NAD(P)-dependent oxidoreductase [Gemmatimonadales bacterium]MYK01187.1 SDR family NAD(P)-dependent oxidoreductase [Candidatus Palauibacter ramosifaciens]
MRATNYNRKLRAFASGVVDRFVQRPTLSPVPECVRLDGRVCLVTGANRGLGKAVAVDLAERGADLLMACRGGHPDAGEDVRRLSGSDRVDMLQVDLADLESVHTLCDRLARERRRVDILVLNAGVMPAKARRSAQGYELMFAVHFLANRVLIDRLLADGVVRPGDRDRETPRIVFIVSETHRAADSIDFGSFGAFADYGLKDGLKYYALSKLHLCTYAQELSRRLNPEGEVRIAVNSLCPGAVDSDLMREAPWFLKPLLYPAKRLLFASPHAAVAPVTHACCAEDMGRRSGVYLHLMREKEMSPPAMDASAGARLWRESDTLLARHLRPGKDGARGLAAGDKDGARGFATGESE